MDRSQMKMLGIACLVVCAICLFVAIERYQSNAGTVQAFSQFSKLSGLDVTPGTPAATRYALLLALLSGIGGVVFLAKSRPSSGPVRRERNGS